LFFLEPTMNWNATLIPIFGMLIPIIIVPVALGIKHSRHLRELDHAERIKAMELGRKLPGDDKWETAPQLAALIGAGVPIGVFGFAWLTSMMTGFHQDIWMSAMTVGVAGVICGTILAAKHFARQAGAENLSAAKPTYDADAFDVVSSRG
jgi:hypothetical protein